MFAADVPSAVTEDECRTLAQMAEGRRVLEAGSQYGRSTIALASRAEVVHAVDWHGGDPWAGPGDSLAAFLANLDRHGVRARVVVHLGRFEDVAPAFRDAYFGLVFVDGAHGYDDVRRDLELFGSKCAAGGFLALHDYARFEGVTRAADGWAAGRGVALRRVAESLAVAYVG